MYRHQGLTVIATLLIGWQLFYFKIADIKVGLPPVNYFSFNPVVFANNENYSHNLDKTEPLILEQKGLAQEPEQFVEYVPPDNGHPSYTQGSGTFI
ncbi:MAG: hypothetical protein F6K36_09715 [Symploca sp. SIO3C6]|uniref:Uncharacterized protein n=1 Tax=Symploca sp. SIO1C4 TaxID=2607765 RepID=A0A6B3NEE4_9CYAN|nr:hypothetical protein [Symploca sp. SIO3C6]NER29967.1 hypothetical protein [Symploca sp. SIO1C4]NET04831.1 hypothetical protein [Symploca sp. SIO2B6]